MKDALAILVGGKDKPGESSAPSDSLGAAKRILRAVKSGDAEALDDALQDHYAACEESHEAPEEAEPDDDDEED